MVSLTLFLLLLLCLALLVLIISLFAYLFSLMLTRAPFIPLPRAKVRAVMDVMSIGEGSVLYDLGSGEGRLVFAAARLQPGARCIGVERALIPMLMARAARRCLHLRSQVVLIQKSFFKVDVVDATHVFCYLMPGLMADMEAKFKSELRPGAKVFSCDFPLPTKAPTQKIPLSGSAHSLGQMLYVYEY